ADMLLCCMPSLPPEKQPAARQDATGDWRYRTCSPYILFEWRLAERLDLPRFMVVDRACRFRRPTYIPPHVKYVERDFADLRARVDAGQTDHLLQAELNQWLDWVRSVRSPCVWSVPTRAAVLMDRDASGTNRQGLLSDAVDQGGFDPPESLTDLFHTDAELYQVLRSLGLLIVDVQSPSLLPLYHAAHSLMVPTIRLHSQSTDKSDADTALPALLQGHPAGYQLDLVGIGNEVSDDTIHCRVLDRTRAASRAAQPVVGSESGVSVLYQRTLPDRHFVFISHNEALHDRPLVNAIVQKLRGRGVTCWEYAVENRSGEIWRKNMNDALTATTLMVALLNPGYEQSPGCVEEWQFAINHEIPLLPFLTRGRTRPNVDLRGDEIVHEPLLETQSPEIQAERIAERVIAWLRNPPKRRS
ncbi:MAG: toll/interleukin-1 receptor domain-containing protein, partial [Planctomycetaceae bacterium]|nr:toll/interleukin-1 receptor domain-containing protein [Planctomycetaceae bacterium]